MIIYLFIYFNLFIILSSELPRALEKSLQPVEFFLVLLYLYHQACQQFPVL